MVLITDYGHPVRKSPSLHGRKSNPNPKFLGTAEAYFVCHIGPKFQISLIYAFIGCPQSVIELKFQIDALLQTLEELFLKHYQHNHTCGIQLEHSQQNVDLRKENSSGRCNFARPSSITFQSYLVDTVKCHRKLQLHVSTQKLFANVEICWACQQF